VKVRDLILLIETDGWKALRTTGSHRHFKHGTKANVVTGPGNPGDDIPIGTLKAKVGIGVAAASRARQKLVPVRVIQEDAPPKPGSGFTLVFSNGLRLEMASDFDTPALARLIGAIETSTTHRSGRD